MRLHNGSNPSHPQTSNTKNLRQVKKLDVCLFFFHLTFFSGEHSEKQLQNFKISRKHFDLSIKTN